MWMRIAAASVVAGLAAGLLLTAMQQMRVAPLIRTAEIIEQAGLAEAPADGHAEHAAWEPETEREKLAARGIANVLLAIGFALIVSAGMTLRGDAGWRRGLAWGAAGYFVFFVAPSIGLPPELPGLESAPLANRTAWWAATVVLTAGGLWLLVHSHAPFVRVAGLLLVLLPHVFGAPHSAAHDVTATRDLVAEFIAATVLANAVFWLVIGAVAGALLAPRNSVPRSEI